MHAPVLNMLNQSINTQARSKLLFTGTANNKSEYTLCSFAHVLIYAHIIVYKV